MREISPELLVTAKTQRWSPEEFLRTLLEAEITSCQRRLKTGQFRRLKSEQFW